MVALLPAESLWRRSGRCARRSRTAPASHRRLRASRDEAELEPELELTEENVQQVLLDARQKLSQLFDLELGMTGSCTLADLDGPFVTLRLAGRFWHPRGMVLARVGAYLQERIPEVGEVRIESEAQLDDSAANF
jgi:hypothetical protein